MKKCKRCGEDDQQNFYKNYSGVCRSCKKEDATIYRRKNINKVRAYDRSRGNRQTPEYRKTSSYKESRKKSEFKWRKENPHKINAHSLVAKAIKAKTLTKKPCQNCGNVKVEAHHTDYSRPLDVIWLCDKHHKEVHKQTRETRRTQ